MPEIDNNLKCRYCGQEGDCGGTIDECANCWEVRKRARDFLQVPVNVQFIRDLLKDAKTPIKSKDG